MVGAQVADVDVQRGTTLLRPGVHAQVRLGQQHGGRDAAGAMHRGRKGMKHLPHRLQATGAHRLQTSLPQGGGIGQPQRRAAASVKVGGEVQSVHGAAL